jgi:hypothetical protein
MSCRALRQVPRYTYSYRYWHGLTERWSKYLVALDMHKADLLAVVDAVADAVQFRGIHSEHDCH